MQLSARKIWRRGSESNRRIKVLQTSPLPLGYRALQLPKFSLTSGNSPSDGKALAGAGLGPEFWSGRRDLNPRLRPWQGRTLPLSYSRSLSHSTALAHLVPIHCTRTGTRSSLRCSSAPVTAPPFGRNLSLNWAWALLALGLL